MVYQANHDNLFFSASFLSYHRYRVLLDGYSNKFMTAWTEPKRSYSFYAISICSYVYIYFTTLGVQEYVLTSYSHLSIIIFQAKIYNFQCLEIAFSHTLYIPQICLNESKLLHRIFGNVLLHAGARI